MIVRELFTLVGVKSDTASMKRAETGLQQITKAARVLTGILAGGLAARGFGALITSASDVEENLNVLRVSFGGLTDEMREFARTTGEEMGRSRFAVEEMVGALGSTFRPIVGSNRAAAELSKTMAKLAIDIESLFNVKDPQRALRALRSALLGEIEPLRNLTGIDIGERSLRDFAKTQGKNLTTLSQVEKVMLRLKFIQSRSTSTTGDAIRTADDWANALRTVRERIREASAFIGRALIPSLRPLLLSVRGIVSGLRDWAESSEEIVKQGFSRAVRLILSALQSLFNAISLVVDGWGSLLDAIGPVASGVLKVAAAVGAAIFVFGAMNILIAALSIAVVALVDDLKAFRDGNESFIGDFLASWERLVVQFGGIRQAISAIVAGLAGELMQMLTGVSDQTAMAWKQNFKDVFDTLAFGVKEFVSFFANSIAGLAGFVSSIFQGEFSEAGRFLDAAAEEQRKNLRNIASIFTGGLELETPDVSELRRSRERLGIAQQERIRSGEEQEFDVGEFLGRPTRQRPGVEMASVAAPGAGENFNVSEFLPASRMNEQAALISRAVGSGDTVRAMVPSSQAIAVPAPLPAASGGGGASGTNATVNTSATINIQTQPGQSNEAIGKVAAARINSITVNDLRQAGVALGGG